MPIPTSLEKIPVSTASEDDMSLSACVTEVLKNYFAALKQEDPVDLYQTVVETVEIPLLKNVMERYRYNQSQVAQILGLSRGTLRTKLRHHFDDQYVGTRTTHDKGKE